MGNNEPEQNSTEERRDYQLAEILTEPELAYISRAIFRQRLDRPHDAPELAAQLDPLISVARMKAKKLEGKDG